MGQDALSPELLLTSRTTTHQADEDAQLWSLCPGGTSSLLTSGPQSRSPAHAKDSKLTWAEFTWAPRRRSVPPAAHCCLLLCVLALNERT